MNFKQLGVIDPILKALAREGYTTPTDIQLKAIPLLLEKRDLLASAQTGTGKTAAFAIPIIQQLALKQQKEPAGIRALVVTPTRELASQIGDSFRNYGRFTRLHYSVIFGGVKQGQQISSLKRGVDVLIATPGRLLDLMDQGHISLKHIEYFVLDEADQMLDMGFIHDIRKLLKRLPERRQSLFFSATMPAPIVELSQQILYKPERISIRPQQKTADKIDQSIYFVKKQEKSKLLVHLLETVNMDSVLVFSRTKYGADKIVKVLKRAGIAAGAIHGNKSQGARERVLGDFKKGETRVLVATDIASRGIDLDALSHVINFDLPNIPETYVHRIGRTGRAAASGIAFSFCDEEEKSYLRDIQKLINQDITVNIDHPYIGEGMLVKEKTDSLPKSDKPGGKKFGRPYRRFRSNRKKTVNQG